MVDSCSQRTFDEFCARSLPRSEWTHEAHLRVCWVALTTSDPGGTVEFLREAIMSYNAATGVKNSATSGYHETLTRYYVGAVASLDSADVDHVTAAPRCSIEAPRRHWSSNVLFSPAARASWIEPDENPLPRTPGSTFGT